MTSGLEAADPSSGTFDFRFLVATDISAHMTSGLVAVLNHLYIIVSRSISLCLKKINKIINTICT